MYVPDGRVLTEVLAKHNVQGDDETLGELVRVYKQINAPVGQLALSTIKTTTGAIESGSASDDHRYAATNRQISAIAAERDDLAGQIKSLLDNVAFHGAELDKGQAQRLIARANALLQRADQLGSTAS